MRNFIKNKKAESTIFLMLLGFVVGLAIVAAWTTLVMNNVENTIRDHGFTLVEVSKIDDTTIIYDVSLEELMTQATAIHSTIIYSDTTPNNGIGYVVVNGSVGWNYKP